MARKSKIETEKRTDSADLTPGASGSAGVIGLKSKSAAAISKPKKTKTTPRKKKAATIKSASSAENPPPAMVGEPSDEQIRLRAYFIAERRFRLSLPGDSAHDWIEARRQLLEEAGDL